MWKFCSLVELFRNMLLSLKLFGVGDIVSVPRFWYWLTRYGNCNNFCGNFTSILVGLCTESMAMHLRWASVDDVIWLRPSASLVDALKDSSCAGIQDYSDRSWFGSQFPDHWNQGNWAGWKRGTVCYVIIAINEFWLCFEWVCVDSLVGDKGCSRCVWRSERSFGKEYQEKDDSAAFQNSGWCWNEVFPAWWCSPHQGPLGAFFFFLNSALASPRGSWFLCSRDLMTTLLACHCWFCRTPWGKLKLLGMMTALWKSSWLPHPFTFSLLRPWTR